jgi:group I intron endonuclease
MSGIYIIRNNINNKIYVGSSKNLKNRLNEHKRKLRKNYHRNYHLQQSFNKYGEDNFTFEIIEECELNQLLQREVFWINYYQSFNRDKGYNLRDPQDNHFYSEETLQKQSQIKMGENNPMFGKTTSEETKRKISEANKGHRHTEETKKLIGELSSKRIHTQETKNKISKANSGKEFSEEHKQKISEGLRGKEKSLEHRQHISESKRGSKSSKAKLTEEQVIEIKKLFKEGNIMIKDIADMYWVKPNTISCIKNGKNWGYINI